jgi:hypothetical protein
VSPALLILGDMSVQGNIKPLRSLTEPLQVAKDNGAKRALIPIENKRNFLDVSADIMEHVDPIFYGDPKTAAMKVLGRLRNNVTFHYDEPGKLVKKAMEQRAKNPDGNITSITRGSEPYSWRFTVADDVLDSIVCREIWKIPLDSDLRAEADAAADYGHQIFVDFADFASDFVTKYVRDGA